MHNFVAASLLLCVLVLAVLTVQRSDADCAVGCRHNNNIVFCNVNGDCSETVGDGNPGPEWQYSCSGCHSCTYNDCCNCKFTNPKQVCKIPGWRSPMYCSFNSEDPSCASVQWKDEPWVSKDLKCNYAGKCSTVPSDVPFGGWAFCDGCMSCTTDYRPNLFAKTLKCCNYQFTDPNRSSGLECQLRHAWKSDQYCFFHPKDPDCSKSCALQYAPR